MLTLDSVLQKEKECLVCHTTKNLHSHHVFFGKNHKMSEKYGMKVWLCADHHNMSDAGIHYNKDLNNEVKKMAQLWFELEYGHAEFMRIFGENYLP